MFFWKNRWPFYPTPCLFFGWLNYKYCQKLFRVEKTTTFGALHQTVGRSSIFCKKTLKKGESLKNFFLSLRVFFWMFLNSFEVLAKNFHEKCMFFTKISKRVKFRWVSKISQNHENWTLFNNEKNFWKWILNVPWGLIPPGG